MDHTKTVGQPNCVRGDSACMGVFRQCMGVPECVSDGSWASKHSVIASEPPNVVVGVYYSLKTHGADFAISL